ncbi:MAG: CNNM domain-containing protein [Phycisphaerae bacterium]
MTWLAGGLAIVVLVALSALFSGAETGIYCLNRLRLRLDLERGHPPARRIAALLRDEQQALAVILAGTNLANYLTTTAAALFLADQFGITGGRLEFTTALTVTPLLFAFGELVPKNLFRRDAIHFLYAVSLPLGVASKALAPLVWGILRLSTLLLKVIGRPSDRPWALDPRQRVVGLLKEALAQSDDAEQHSEFIDRVLRLSDTPIQAVMLPAEQVVTISADADRASFLAVVGRSEHSRFPVHRGPSNRIVGLVDALALLNDTSWHRIEDKLGPIETVDPATSVAAAILKVRRTGQRMFMVPDGRGRMLGIVTLKDLMEEVVGELHDW